MKIPLGPGYQVPMAAKVRAETGIVTRAVGLIVEPAQAEAIVASGQADCVAMARAFLDNPRWVWHAAERLGARIAYPPQYARAAPCRWPGAAMARPGMRTPEARPKPACNPRLGRPMGPFSDDGGSLAAPRARGYKAVSSLRFRRLRQQPRSRSGGA